MTLRRCTPLCVCCVDAWRAYVRPAAQATACGLPVRLSDGGAGTLEAKLERRPENPGSTARRPNSWKKRDGQPIGVRTPYVYPTRGYGYVVLELRVHIQCTTVVINNKTVMLRRGAAPQPSGPSPSNSHTLLLPVSSYLCGYMGLSLCVSHSTLPCEWERGGGGTGAPRARCI